MHEAALKDPSLNGAQETVEEAISQLPRLTPTQKLVIPVLTPTMGMVSMWWHTCILDLVWPMNTGKAIIPTMDLQGGQVGEMRNRLVAMALAAEKHHGVTMPKLMWIDDDVLVNRCALLALAQHDRPIVSGVYFCKGEFGTPLIFGGPSAGTLPFRPNETFEAWGWAQGLCLVDTEVYKRMRDELDLGVDSYGNPQWYKTPPPTLAPDGQMTIGGTEDFHFFANANRLGYRPLIDCSSYAFGFHYDQNVKHAWPKQQWEMYLKREAIVWPTKDGEVVWA